ANVHVHAESLTSLDVRPQSNSVATPSGRSPSNTVRCTSKHRVERLERRSGGGGEGPARAHDLQATGKPPAQRAARLAAGGQRRGWHSRNAGVAASDRVDRWKHTGFGDFK